MTFTPWKESYDQLAAAAAAKSLQSCLTLCDPRDGSPPGSPIPGILQARTLEWVAISLSNAWKWKVKGKSLSRVRLSDPMDCSTPVPVLHYLPDSVQTYVHWANGVIQPSHPLLPLSPHSLCSFWVQPQKWQNDLSSFPRQTIQCHSNPSLPHLLMKLIISMKTEKTS